MPSEAIAQININLPKEKAWEKLQDFSLAHNYVPGIIKTEITTDKRNGLGASRKVYQSSTRALDETIVEWNEGKGFKIKLHKGPKDAPFKDAHFIYELADGPNNTTNLTTTMSYQPPLAGFGRFLDKAFLNKIISNVIQEVALSMKLYYETSKPTTKADLKAFKQSQN
ncbi:MAG: SRPBCC family protein [Pseudomonadales bacterium]|nr:SRPBCC family protein [Pseudomonadales bacterium]